MTGAPSSSFPGNNDTGSIASESTHHREKAGTQSGPPSSAHHHNQQEQQQQQSQGQEKQRMTKAERRAQQEAQRQKKAEQKHSHQQQGGSKGQGRDATTSQQQRPGVAMQYDDKKRLEKRNKRSVVERVEAPKAVEMFAHLPQYEHWALQERLQKAQFDTSALHPAIMQLGIRYAHGQVRGGRARALALVDALYKAVEDHVTPPEKEAARHLTSEVNKFVQYLIDCRPMGVCMANVVKSFKSKLATMAEEAHDERSVKDAALRHLSWFARPYFISHRQPCKRAKPSRKQPRRYKSERLEQAKRVVQEKAGELIRDGDVVATVGRSTVVEQAFIEAKRAGKDFSVAVVDSRPLCEGRGLTQRLLQEGIPVSYTNLSGCAVAVQDATKVMMGAAGVQSNGTVLSRVGSACLAVCAGERRLPVLVCAESAKFQERAQYDSVTFNELGDADRIDAGPLAGWRDADNLTVLSLLYDLTPSDCITAIVSEPGILPPTSVPVVLREAREA